MQDAFARIQADEKKTQKKIDQASFQQVVERERWFRV